MITKIPPNGQRASLEDRKEGGKKELPSRKRQPVIVVP